MADIDLGALSLEELRKLEKDVAKAIKSFEARRKAEARAAAEVVLREYGYSFAEIAGDMKSGRSIGAPMYQHPENPELTWTGRGRKPAWFIAATDEGKTAEDLLIG